MAIIVSLACTTICFAYALYRVLRGRKQRQLRAVEALRRETRV